MKIHKIGHNCFVFEKDGTRMLTDPGNLTSGQTDEKDLDVVLITHIHADHLDIETFKKVLENNPGVNIVGNREVVDMLSKEGIEASLIKDQEEMELGSFKVQAHETDHHAIYEGIPLPRNTGFLIDEKVFLSGDAMEVIIKNLDLLGIPIGAPFAGMSDFIEYGKKVSPKKAMPAHDGNLKELGPFARVPQMLFEKMGIEYIPMEGGDSLEI